MSDQDLQNLINVKEQSVTRKRQVCANSSDNVRIRVPLPDLDFNDPDFLKILKEYEDDSDSSNERKQFETQRRSGKHNGDALNNGLGYTILTGVVLVFIILINWFNNKELERLKEEFGFEDRHLYTEQWWKRGFFYVVHVPTFADTNDDNIGDIDGIRKHVNHFEYLGVDAIVLTCLVETHKANDPIINCGATTNFTNVNPSIGNLDDLRRLIHELNEKGIKVIIQIDPNHTHKDHKWFVESRKGGVNSEFENFYIWNKGKTFSNGSRYPPNNWLNINGNPAWFHDSISDRFYYHVYDQALPDLNHRHPSVRKEFLKIFEFWLEKGADGILLTSVEKLLEVEDAFLNEPKNEYHMNLTGYKSLHHVYTLDQPEVHDYISSWRQFFEEYYIKRQKHFCLLLEVGSHSTTDVVRYYHTGADLAISNPLINLPQHCGGECVHEVLEEWINRVGDDAIWMRYNLLNDGHVKGKLRDAFNILLMLLPGSAMLHHHDFMSSNLNVEPEKLVELVHQMSRLRRDRSFLIGQIKFIHIDQNVIAFVRFANTQVNIASQNNNSPVNIKEGIQNERLNSAQDESKKETEARRLRRKDPTLRNLKLKKRIADKKLDGKKFNSDDALFSSSVPYVVAINFGEQRSTVDLATTLGSTKGRVILTRLDAENRDKIVVGGMVDLINFTLYSGEAIILIPMLDDEE